MCSEKTNEMIAENSLKTLAYGFQTIGHQDYLMEYTRKHGFQYREPVIGVDIHNRDMVYNMVQHYMNSYEQLLSGKFDTTIPLDDRMEAIITSRENALKVSLMCPGCDGSRIKGSREIGLMPLSDCIAFNNVVVSGHSNIFDKNYIGKGYGRQMYEVIDNITGFIQIPNHYERFLNFEGVSDQAKRIWDARLKSGLLPEKINMDSYFQMAKNLRQDMSLHVLGKKPEIHQIIDFINNIEEYTVSDFSDLTQCPIQNHIMFQINNHISSADSNLGVTLDKKDAITSILKLYDFILTEDEREMICAKMEDNIFPRP